MLDSKVEALTAKNQLCVLLTVCAEIHLPKDFRFLCGTASEQPTDRSCTDYF